MKYQIKAIPHPLTKACVDAGLQPKGFCGAFRSEKSSGYKVLRGRISEVGPGRIVVWFKTADEALDAVRAHLRGQKKYKAA